MGLSVNYTIILMLKVIIIICIMYCIYFKMIASTLNTLYTSILILAIILKNTLHDSKRIL